MDVGAVVVICGALMGCFSKPPAPTATVTDAATVFDATADAVEQVTCDGIAFPTTPVKTYNELAGAYDVAMNPSLLEVFYVQNPAGTQEADWEIVQKTRNDLISQFSSPVVLPFNAPGADHADLGPAITEDGSIMVFTSDRSGSRIGYQVVRTGQQWGTPVPMPGLLTPMETLDISPNGLTLYFTTPGSVLRSATRPSVTDDFTDTGLALGTARFEPSVSASGRELFYDGNGAEGVQVAVLVGDQFGAGQTLIPGTLDADLLPNGEDLFYVSDALVVQALHRDCPLARAH